MPQKAKRQKKTRKKERRTELGWLEESSFHSISLHTQSDTDTQCAPRARLTPENSTELTWHLLPFAATPRVLFRSQSSTSSKIPHIHPERNWFLKVIGKTFIPLFCLEKTHERHSLRVSHHRQAWELQPQPPGWVGGSGTARRNTRLLFDLQKAKKVFGREPSETPSGQPTGCRWRFGGWSGWSLGSEALAHPESHWVLKPGHTGVQGAHLAASSPCAPGTCPDSMKCLVRCWVSMCLYSIYTALNKDSHIQICCGCVSFMMLFVSKPIWRGERVES